MNTTTPFDTNLLIDTLLEKNYQVYTRPYELNIIGVRADNVKANSFDDQIQVLFYDEESKPIHVIFNATTDPGTFWLRNPAAPSGTAILAQGQYENGYQIGLHRGKYEALIQRRPVTVIRDYDRNATLDFLNGRKETGFFGINVHHASEDGTSKTIDEYSAGCQVFANIEDFNLFMQLCYKHRELYGNVFSYTLIDQRALARSKKRTIAYALTGVGFGIGAYIIYRSMLNKKMG